MTIAHMPYGFSYSYTLPHFWKRQGLSFTTGEKATLSVEWDLSKLKKSYVDFNDIRHGGTLELVMGPKPSKWATTTACRP